MRPSDELTPEERAWLEEPDTHRGYQPVGEGTGTHHEPPPPPPGRAGASRSREGDEEE